MLFESISYISDLPFKISFLNVGQESRHCHKEVEILMVLRGVTHYRIYHMDYELGPGDLIIADAEDLHQIHDSSDDILILSLHVDTRRFEKQYPNIRYMFFVCEECMEGPSGSRQLLENKLTLLKQHIARLAFDYGKDKKDLPLLREEIKDLVSILVNHFQGFYMEDFQYKTSQQDMSPDDLQRLCRITRYIMLHYNQKISLDDIAEMEHLSTYYLSHLIKENLGFNFQNFVNSIRLEFAEKLLVFSNMTLMQISQECGFSSPNYFNKCFSAWHGKTPAQYRKAYVPCERSCRRPFTRKEAFALLTPYLNVSKGKGEVLESISIAPDFSNSGFIGFCENYGPRICVDSGEAALFLGACSEKILQLSPREIILTEDLLHKSKGLAAGIRKILEGSKIPLSVQDASLPPLKDAPDPAAALSQIFSCKDAAVSLLGGAESLFTQEGLPTPLYTVYEVLSDLKEPQAAFYPHYVLAKGLNGMLVALFNPASHAALHVHLSVKHLPPRTAFIRRELSPGDSVFGILENLGNPEHLPPLLEKRICQNRLGHPRFFVPEKKTVDLVLYPNTVILLEIPSVCH